MFLPARLAYRLHEIFDQHQDVVLPLSQRGHLDGKHIQPIKQVLAKGSFGNGCFQITIGGSDDANVDVDRLPSPDSLKFPFL